MIALPTPLSPVVTVPIFRSLCQNVVSAPPIICPRLSKTKLEWEELKKESFSYNQEIKAPEGNIILIIKEEPLQVPGKPGKH